MSLSTLRDSPHRPPIRQFARHPLHYQGLALNVDHALSPRLEVQTTRSFFGIAICPFDEMVAVVIQLNLISYCSTVSRSKNLSSA